MRRLIAAALLLSATALPAANLESRLREIAKETTGTVGVAALDLESGRSVSIRGSERFPMGSVYKFPIALTVLHQVDAAKLALDRKITIPPSEFSRGYSPLRDNANGKSITLTIGELLEHMLGKSDNTASDVLMRLVGGPSAITKRMQVLGIQDIRIDRSELQMAIDLDPKDAIARYSRDPRDTSTPDAMRELLRKMWLRQDGLTPASHARLVQIMEASPTGPRRIRGRLPADAKVAHKTGTMPGTVNDAGVITSPDGKHHIVVVVFTKSPQETTNAEREPVIAKIAKAIYDEYTR